MVNCLAMCTGNFTERDLSDTGNAMQRPPPGTKCAEPCVFESGRWGSSWCYTDGNGQWGAECVSCEGMIHFQVYSETDEFFTLVKYHFSMRLDIK